MPDPDSIPLLSKSQVRSARQLLQRRGRAESGHFLIEGSQAVREALARPDVVEAVIVDDPSRHAALVALADPDRTWRAQPADIAQLADTVTPQGIFAVCRQLPAQWNQVVDPQLVVICSQVRDPGNAGTVIRCADAFGADLVVLTTDSVEVYNPKTVRASAGSIFHLPIITGESLTDVVGRLRQQGVQIVAAAGGGVSLDQYAAGGGLARPTAWIMGNEAWGLPESDRALADHVVGVPMWGRAESLNLSTAAAVCLYATASAQRNQPPPEASAPEIGAPEISES